MMKSIRLKIGRRIFNVLALLSLLMGIAVAALWGRSVWWSGDSCWVFQSPTSDFFIYSAEGVISAEYWPDRSMGSGFYSRLHRYGYLSLPPEPTNWMTPIDGSFKGVTRINFPDWMLLLLLSALPVRAFVLFHRRRRLPGLCAKCGCSLQANTDKCPECGRPIPPPMTSVVK